MSKLSCHIDDITIARNAVERLLGALDLIVLVHLLDTSFSLIKSFFNATGVESTDIIGYV